MSAGSIYADFRARGGVADLSGRTKLRITGADRARYLNGQVTASVLHLAPGQALPACITTAKGKLCAEVIIHATADALYLDADAAVRGTLPPRLDRYIVSDDVTVEDVTDSLRLVHIVGELAPASDLTDLTICAARSHRLGAAGWDLWLTSESFSTVWPLLTARLAELPADFQEMLRIEAGIPRWGRELGENTLPPEAGLDRTHIDYNKGCYIGQEVISRLKSVGHINRELSGFAALGDTPLQTGAQLFAPGSNERPVGTLTSEAFSFALERWIALGYLKRGAAFPELVARNIDTTEVRVAPHTLPFAS